MDWQAAKSELSGKPSGNSRIEVQHGGFGSVPGVWSEVVNIKGPIGFGSDSTMVQLAGSNGYILVSPRANYRIRQ